MNDVVNPIAPPSPTFDIPAGQEVSNEAKEFALAPVFVSVGVNRAPTDAEQVARLAQAKDILGDRFLQPAVAQPTAAEKAETDRLQMLGINPASTPGDYQISLPPGTNDDTRERISGAMSALRLTKDYGNHLASRVVYVGRHIGEMSESERSTWQASQQRFVEEWAERHNWNLPEVTAKVERLMKESKVDGSVAALLMLDSDSFIRLAHIILSR